MAPNMVVVFWLRLAVVVIDFLLAGLLLRRTLKTEAGLRQKYYAGAAAFFLIHAACRIVFLMYNFYFEEIKVMWNIGTILGLVGIIAFVWTIESTVYQWSKHIFTLVGTVGVGLMIVDIFVTPGDNGITELAQMIFDPILAVFIIVVYLQAGRKTQGDVRNGALIMMIGIILFGLGEMGNSSIAMDIIPLAAYIAPLFCLFGLILVWIAVVKYTAV